MKPKTGDKLMKKKREKTQITNIRKERDISYRSYRHLKKDKEMLKFYANKFGDW